MFRSQRNDTGAKPAPAKDLGDALKFINNDLLHGSLITIDEQNGVRWKNPEAKEPIEFKISSVSQIKLQSARSRRNNTSSACGLRTNDEVARRH